MPWIKICGLRTREAIDAAVDGGADAIGFVFAPSKRRVDAEQAVRLVSDVSRRTMRVAVMQHPSQDLLDEVCRIFQPDALQTDADDFAYLKVPNLLQKLPVIREGAALMEPVPARVLYEGQVSGAGATADWRQAKLLARSTQLILAGGLHAANVVEAISSVEPFGVDVSSGVESAPGVKDSRKILEFIRTVRAASARPGAALGAESGRTSPKTS